MTERNLADIDAMATDVKSEVLKKWRDKIKLTIDDQGYVKAGWGYPQSVPEISPAVSARLEQGEADLSEAVAELRDRDPA